jgi:CheY-like chemotaxis protein
MEDKPTIMVVDDSELSRDTLRGFFSEVGCEVLCIESAEAAWTALCAGRRVDLIILDWHLPLGMSGPTFNRKIMVDQRFKKIPVVAFSSRWDGQGGTFEAREWVASFTGTDGGNLKVRDHSVVAKPDGDPEARHVPPDLVISVAERLEQLGRVLPPALQEAAASLKMARFAV